MLASNSFPTPAGGVTAELVRVGAVTAVALDSAHVKGKIVLADGRLSQLFTLAVQQRGAAGVLSYAMPKYTQPERYRNSIQFTGIPYDSGRRGWAMPISFAAREQLMRALAAGPVTLRVVANARFTQPATELALVAEIRGSTRPDERWVWSAHVQEPGANDNASGVGTLQEMARVAAELVTSGKEDPRRTLTFLWGQEIIETGRFIKEDTLRARGIRWGMSLDMVGEDTRKTGGTFLIEKMPDPSAVWTRGDDHHTEWGGSVLKEDRMTPHYFNDYVLQRCLDQARESGWIVKTNPFEGGSDHTPFLTAGKAGIAPVALHGRVLSHGRRSPGHGLGGRDAERRHRGPRERARDGQRRRQSGPGHRRAARARGPRAHRDGAQAFRRHARAGWRPGV